MDHRPHPDEVLVHVLVAPQEHLLLLPLDRPRVTDGQTIEGGDLGGALRWYAVLGLVVASALASPLGIRRPARSARIPATLAHHLHQNLDDSRSHGAGSLAKGDVKA